MRAALAPSTRFNPDIEPEIPGCAVRHDVGGWWWGEKGWVKDHRKARRHQSIESARYTARMLAGATVTTIPRFNGYCVEWIEVPA
jgi:hypothetical protein